MGDRQVQRAGLLAKLLALFGGLFIVVLLLDLVIMPLYTRQGFEYELPDVTEKQLDQAAGILSENGFIPIVQDSVYDVFYPKGTVLRQNPTSFSTVKKGRRVYLMVSNGEKPIFMPKLVSETLINAELKLREVGLQLGRINHNYSKRYPYRDVVVAQSVPPGERIAKSKAINLTVSLGPPPSSLVMPNMSGKSLNSAINELGVLGLSRGKIYIRHRYLPNLVPNTVVSQSSPAGVIISELNSVELTVSTDQIQGRGDNNNSRGAR